MVCAPAGWSVAPAMAGGHSAAQAPLQVLLPLPATSLSKVESVMPLASTRAPLTGLAGGSAAMALESGAAKEAAAIDIAARLRRCFMVMTGELRVVGPRCVPISRPQPPPAWGRSARFR